MKTRINLSENTKIFIKALERLSTVFAVYDEDGNLVFANRAAREALPAYFGSLENGDSIREATIKQIKFQAPKISSKDLLLHTNLINDQQFSGKQYEVEGTRNRTFAVKHEKLTSNTYIGHGMDVSELKRQQSKLEMYARLNFNLANTDQLTDLANRRYFINKLDTTILKSKKDQSTFHVGLLDLNGFKRINDLYGHTIGDKLLKMVANNIKRSIKKHDFVARLGGDEFAIISHGNPDQIQLSSISKKICSSVSDTYELSGNRIQISSSLGWCSFPQNGQTVSDLLRKSDYALYQSKENRIKGGTIFSNQHEIKIKRQSSICIQLECAPLADELFLQFQPIHDTTQGKIIAFEALARWDSKKLGTVHPAEFIPLAERMGCISKLSRILLVKALALAQHWPADIHLHFNLSGMDLCEPKTMSELIKIVQGSDFPTSQVIFEVTETAVIDNLDGLSNIFKLLEDAGIKLSLDDFGVGYSSLSYLTRIPVSILKIDKSFIDHLKPNSEKEAILETIHYLCNKLKIECIVEGVEDTVQYKQLSSLGFNNMQGYFFSEPMPTHNVAAYILNFIQSGNNTLKVYQARKSI